jgi:uncharacterized repeat protein (TIGR02543 family)
LKRAIWLAVLALVVGVVTSPSQAATIAVAAGEVAVNPGNGTCSLREAILNAEAGGQTSGGDCAAGEAGPNIISLAAGSTYTLPDQDPHHADGEVNGLPEIHTQITINGNAATIQRDPALFSGTACGGAGAKFRIFYVSGLGDLILNNLTLQNGCANDGSVGAGGAIFNRGTLGLDTVTISNNEALRSGGAIHNDGDLTLTRSTVSNNAVTATEAGGGGIVNRGTMQVLQSTISGNDGAGAGGGVDTGLGNAAFANSTVSGNTSEGDGGGIFNRSPSTTVVNSTVALNRGTNSVAAGLGSGIYVDSGTVTLSNSLVVQQVNGANCSGVSGGGNNLADDGTCPTATVTATPLIGSLADYGGTTETHALLLGSPAIDTGSNTICNASPVSAVDQRGVSRPQGTTCDIGAFELHKYSVAYNGNGNTGGSVPIDANFYATGETVTVLGNTGPLVKTGHTFSGWNTAANGSGTPYTGGSTFAMGSGNVTLYAQWTINTYTVTYNGNGHTGGGAPVDGSSPYDYNSTVTVAGPGSLTRTGHTFAGWNTAANGSGTAYAPSATFNIAANTTLFAQWTINTYTVTYNGNFNTGGSAPVDGSSPYNFDSTVTVAGQGSLIRTGHTFAGWNTAANGSGTAYAPSATFNIAANTTLFAQWTINTHTVTYNGNGHTGGGAPVDGSSPYNFDSTVTVAGQGSLIRTGHTFAGWNTAANGSGTAFAPGATFNIVANTTLFAQWTVNNTYTAPSATGTGNITASFTGGGASCGYTLAQFIPLTGHAASPPAGSAPHGISFPEGLFDFIASGCTPGSTLNFTITYPQPLPPGTEYWKYGPTSTDTTPHWYVLPAVISGNVVTFSITDGGLGDDDLAPNGAIVDQGGPGALITPVPALSEWMFALLALLLVGLGLRQGLWKTR